MKNAGEIYVILQCIYPLVDISGNEEIFISKAILDSDFEEKINIYIYRIICLVLQYPFLQSRGMVKLRRKKKKLNEYVLYFKKKLRNRL